MACSEHRGSVIIAEARQIVFAIEDLNARLCGESEASRNISVTKKCKYSPSSRIGGQHAAVGTAIGLAGTVDPFPKQDTFQGTLFRLACLNCVIYFPARCNLDVMRKVRSSQWGYSREVVSGILRELHNACALLYTHIRPIITIVTAFNVWYVFEIFT